jgi:hypothetical protein
MRILYGFDRPAIAPLNWEWIEHNCNAELIKRLRDRNPNYIPVELLLEGADEKRFFDVLENAIIVDRNINGTFYQFADDFRTEDQHRYLARLDRYKLSSRSKKAPRWYPPFPPVYGDLLLHIYYREEHERLNKFFRLVDNIDIGKVITQLDEIQKAGGTKETPLEYVDAFFAVLPIIEPDTDPYKFDLNVRRVLRKNIASKYLVDPSHVRNNNLSADFAIADPDSLLGIG